MELLGIDIGGSGIKAGIVDLEQGQLITDRHRIPTPKPSKPEAVAKVVYEMVSHFEWKGPVGVCFPAVVVKGVATTQANIHKSWKGVSVRDLFEKQCGLPFYVLNDADAAGMAEMTFGVGKEKMGLVIMITIGTGLGSGVFYDGTLIPNLELGRILGKDGRPIELWAANSARKREDLSYKKWGKRFNFYLHHLVRVCSPDLFILGGGASKKMHKFEKKITVDTPILVAGKKNRAGIIGAAMYAQQQLSRQA